MSSFATRRLIDASAKLDPADRALLNLWVNRGLDDERLTQLTGLSIEALGTRRERIVARLAAELGLPESDIRGALDQIAPDEEFATAPGPAEITVEPSGPNGTAPPASPIPPQTATEAPPAPPQTATEAPPAPPQTVTGAPPRTATEAPPQPAAEPAPPPRRGRGRWAVLGLAALVVIVAVVIVATTGGRPSPEKARPAASTQSSTAAIHTSTPPAPAHPTGGPVPVPLAGLPGGLAHASGAVKLSGSVKNLRLNLTVRGLSPAHAGHYEVWLYNSVLDSRPLARLRTGQHRLVVRLPARARHYRWIDISFQPVGVIIHSGESELRASNPAHATKARLRKRSSRTRHRLRQASTVSAAHAATHHRTTARAQAHRAHRRKRSPRGSKNSKTSK